ncbi:hypothetical protein [Streptomyces sp. ISL-100]|uniref:hypothetical protein n=1 Tax=Streptomyces sp. ISL-100 TaxID=2819173 RepID=UPI001BECD394|nr:hypothetical protein [Streptomyces sp. ISL-100]MBT2395186.1 hypothetical protein [Streptomyces sp. ISL-100]
MPRWDLLVCLGVSAVGVAGCLAVLRRGPFPQPGALVARRFWWPEQRSAWMFFGLFAWLMPVFLLLYASMSYSPEAWRIVDAGHTIRAVEVQQVMSSEYVKNQRTRNGHYVTEVQVLVPFDSGNEPEEGKVFSETPVEPGDQVWALYAPSSASPGAIVAGDRGSLEEKTGASAGAPLVLLTLGWTAGCLLLALGGGGLAGATRRFRPALRKGRSRCLLVTVVEAGVALDERPPKGSVPNRPKPVLRLEAAHGERLDLFTDRVVDPVDLARRIVGSRAKLYWGPGAQVERHAASAAHAVLVVEGEGYINGWAETSDGSGLPEGSPVPAAKQLPEGRELRALRTYPVWHPALHSAGLWALLISLLALAITAIGVSNVWTLVLAAVAFLSPAVAWMVTASRRTRHLENLLPDVEPTTDPAGSR